MNRPYRRLHQVVGRSVDAASFWDTVRQQILATPQLVAQSTGIEQIGYLKGLAPPQPSATLRAVRQLYHDKAVITAHWRRKSELYWKEFTASVGVRTLRDLTQDIIAAYKSKVLTEPTSSTYVKHRFSEIKTILAYSKAWGMWAEDRKRALAFCSILVAPSTVSMDPAPISRDHFQRLLDVAAGSDCRLRSMRAILLVALNCCMLPIRPIGL